MIEILLLKAQVQNMLHRPRLFTRHVKRTLLSCGVVFMAGLAPALAADPTGDWRVADGVANIRVAECNGSIWGAVSWEQTPGGRDTNNPDASKQSRPTLAMPILLDMKKEAGGKSWKGVVYNAKDGKSYDTTITPVGNDQMKIEGCVLGFLCGGETWTRVSGPIPSSPSNASKATKSAKSTAQNATAQNSATPGAATAPARLVPGQKTAMPGKKPAAPGQMADIGDICLIPEIASAPLTTR